VLGQELLKRRGLRVPQDLSLLAFGPLPPVARLQEPEVSLYNADLIGAGRELYSMMQEASEQKEPRSFEIQWSLSEGGTLGPLKRP
jgi:DNA-binding LacI/PurR family transcriptional regulator